VTVYDLSLNARQGLPTVRPGRLRIAREQQAVDLEAAEQAVTDLLVALGHDPGSEHLVETPRRVARSYAELLTPRDFDLTTFPNDEGYDELVLARGIPFQSLCQHHLLPFSGVAHVGYLPGERLLGLSKLARVVELFARDLQVQERLTKQVADWLQEHLPQRRGSGARSRTPVHVPAGCPGGGDEGRDLGAPGAAAGRRPLPTGVLRPHRDHPLTSSRPGRTTTRSGRRLLTAVISSG
jgi:GTP cyclohydrolase I